MRSCLFSRKRAGRQWLPSLGRRWRGERWVEHKSTTRQLNNPPFYTSLQYDPKQHHNTVTPTQYTLIAGISNLRLERGEKMQIHTIQRLTMELSEKFGVKSLLMVLVLVTQNPKSLALCSIFKESVLRILRPSYFIVFFGLTMPRYLQLLPT